MTDKTLDSLVGGSEFVLERALDGGTIPIGSVGDVLVITPPPGRRVRLSALNSTDIQSYVSITCGVRTIVYRRALSPTPSISGFAVGPHSTVNENQLRSLSGYIEHITGNVDEVLTIKFSYTSTVEVSYNYQFGS